MSKDEVIGRLQHEGRILLDLLSKVDPQELDDRLMAGVNGVLLRTAYASVLGGMPLG